eukprot:jgi/Ulvmu1/10723/UM068_0008.1
MAFPAVNVQRARASVVNALRAGPAKSQKRKGTAVAMAGKHLLALDFDGVVCDSCGESALSAWRAAEGLWPEMFKAEGVQDQKDGIMEKMRAVRPVVETGFENIIQVRALLEGVTVADMLERWPEMLAAKMDAWQLNRGEMVELFGRTRDDWMAADLDGWLAPNRMYDGVAPAMVHAMAAADAEVFIVTTKQERFTKTILERMAGIDFPLERIYSMTVSGKPKAGVLKMLQEEHPGYTAHFVEDKLSTLQKIEKDEGLGDYNLYLVDWGYNTEPERHYARDSSRIELINMDRFGELMTAV